MGIILNPTYEITRKNKVFKWTEAQEAGLLFEKCFVRTLALANED